MVMMMKDWWKVERCLSVADIDVLCQRHLPTHPQTEVFSRDRSWKELLQNELVCVLAWDCISQ